VKDTKTLLLITITGVQSFVVQARRFGKTSARGGSNNFFTAVI